MLFKLLPDLPYGNQETVFDPAGYGQYLGGTFNNPKKWYKRKQPILDHSVGQEISSNYSIQVQHTICKCKNTLRIQHALENTTQNSCKMHETRIDKNNNE